MYVAFHNRLRTLLLHHSSDPSPYEVCYDTASTPYGHKSTNLNECLYAEIPEVIFLCTRIKIFTPPSLTHLHCHNEFTEIYFWRIQKSHSLFKLQTNGNRENTYNRLTYPMVSNPAHQVRALSDGADYSYIGKVSSCSYTKEMHAKQTGVSF